jgi:hypothetical protein
LPDFPRCNVPKRWKIYQMTTKYTKWLQIIPNVYKIYQLATKYTNIFRCKTLWNLPNLGHLAWKYTIWQPWLARVMYRSCYFITYLMIHSALSTRVVSF